MIDNLLAEMEAELPGWMLSLYWPTETHGPRAVLIRPDYKVQIGRNGKAIHDAFRSAIDAAKRGERE